MSALKKILCAVDFSDTSRQALVDALSLGQSLGAELVILHVVDQRPYEDLERLGGSLGSEVADSLAQVMATREDEAAEKLKAWLGELEAARVPHTSRVRAGNPWMLILETAQEEQVDLMVLGAHGRTSLINELRFGSSAEKVFRRAQCRVMFVR